MHPAVAHFMNNLEPWGQFLTGLAAFLAVVIPVFRWLIVRPFHKARKDLQDATSETMHRIIKEKWSEAIESVDPESYWTLDVTFEGDHQMRIPMFPYKRLTVAENIKMAIVAHGRENTMASLICDGFGHLPPHFHPTTCETLEVKYGTVTHIETGHIYRAGDSWHIPAGEMHSATFQDAFVLITYKPPLKTAKESPPDFARLEDAFK